ncbi:MAG: M1 family aminopeptidase [Acidobacteriota bacterium]
MAVLLALWTAALAAPPAPVSELARNLLASGLDAEECYRVRELHFARQDLRFYLTDGYLIFARPVGAARITAVFSADVEGGDAEVLVFPPHRSERRSLAFFTGSPNLNEHFHSAVLIATDGTIAALAEQLRARGEVRRSPEMGLLLAQKWDPVVRNFLASFQVRLVNDLAANRLPAEGLFYAALAARKLGNFDVVYDPRAPEQITAGQVAFRESRSYFDFWTHFQARSFRSRAQPAPSPEVTLRNFRIEATLEPNLELRAVTRVRVTPSRDATRVLAFNISPRMRVSAAEIDGAPAEVFQPESLRVNLIRGDDNALFLVAPAAELQPGREYEFAFRHEGAVISEAGNRVYYVGARGSWYPNAGLQFARYDLTFRYPKELNLVASGQVVEEREEGAWRITRRRTDSPVRLAGFNLGDYERERIVRAGYTVEVYANRRLEKALEPRSQQVLLLPPPSSAWPRSRTPAGVIAVPLDLPRPDPAARLQQVAAEIAAGLEFMAGHFGPPPLRTLTVAPIPGTFGQGFPGLVYLSTLTYMDPKQRPAAARDEAQQTFFSEILHAHETAHQWWGNVVTTAGYQDDWLMEALANYSALLFLEKRKGSRALEETLAQYRNRLLEKTEEGQTIESVGPLVWGPRLRTSQAPGAWRAIIYDKGSWVLHMLRGRLGDQRFLGMLGELRRRYQYRAVSTEQFRRLAAEFLPAGSPDPSLEQFFEQWVYGTGIPSLRMKHSVRGKAPAIRVEGTITQSDADEDFGTHVPVEIQFAKARPVRHWVWTSSEPASFTVTVRQPATKVSLDPGNAVLRR